jgi:hypothetical protein
MYRCVGYTRSEAEQKLHRRRQSLPAKLNIHVDLQVCVDRMAARALFDTQADHSSVAASDRKLHLEAIWLAI